MIPQMWSELARFGLATAALAVAGWLAYRIGDQYGRGRRRAFTVILFALVVGLYVWLYDNLLHSAQTITGSVLTILMCLAARRWRQAIVESDWRPSAWTDRDAGYWTGFADKAERDQRRMPRFVSGLAGLWLLAWAPLLWAAYRPLPPVYVAVSPIDGDRQATRRLVAQVEDALEGLGHVHITDSARPVDAGDATALKTLLLSERPNVIVWAEPGDARGDWLSWEVVQAADAQRMRVASKMATQYSLWVPQPPRLAFAWTGSAGQEDGRAALADAVRALVLFEQGEWDQAIGGLQAGIWANTAESQRLGALSLANQEDSTLDSAILWTSRSDELGHVWAQLADETWRDGEASALGAYGPDCEAWLAVQRALPMLRARDIDDAAVAARTLSEDARVLSGYRRIIAAADATDAYVYALSSQSAQAIETAREVIRQPGQGEADGLAWAAMGIAEVTRGDQAKGLAYCQRALDIGLPVEVEAWVRQSMSLAVAVQGRTQEALDHLNQTLDQGQSPVLITKALAFRGLLRYLQGQRDEGMLDLYRAIQGAPRPNDAAAALMMRSQAYRTTAKSSAALDDLDQALDLAQDALTLGQVYVLRAQLYADMGYSDKVRADLVNAQSLGYPIPLALEQYLR